MKKTVRILNGKGKTPKQYTKQAKRWFGRNPNRIDIVMQTDKGDVKFNRYTEIFLSPKKAA